MCLDVAHWTDLLGRWADSERGSPEQGDVVVVIAGPVVVGTVVLDLAILGDWVVVGSRVMWAALDVLRAQRRGPRP
jgi:hypothetical protein